MTLHDPELMSGSTTEMALIAIANERRDQDRRKAEGCFEFTCADSALTNAEKLTILVEEVGEVAREVLTQDGRRLARDTEGTVRALHKEVIQVAAVATAWVEALSYELAADSR
jgi:NTP pyrophosphatase (non-canonical NTP hydrolase)